MTHRHSILSKDFLLVAVGQIVSIFGNQMLRYALPLYLLLETGSSALFGTVMACSVVPMILLFPIGGILADRVNKRHIMVCLDFATAGLVLLFCLLMGRVNIVVLMAVTMMLLYGIQGAYQPAVKASVPVLVDAAHIMQGNSIVDVINSLGSMIGPGLGGVLFSLVGLAPVLYVSIGCFFASAVMELFLRIPHHKRTGTGNALATGLADLRESFGFVFRERPVLWKAALLLAAINLFATSLVLIGVPVLVTQHLGFAPDAANRLYGYAQGGMAAGSILGGLLAGLFARRLRAKTSPYLLAGCALPALFGGIALQTFADSSAIYLVLVVGCGLLTTLTTLLQIQILTYLQQLTPRHLTGKVTACVICVCLCTNPVGQMLYGLLFEALGRNVHLPFYGAALLLFAVSLLARRVFAGFMPLDGGRVSAQDRGLRPHPQPFEKG